MGHLRRKNVNPSFQVCEAIEKNYNKPKIDRCTCWLVSTRLLNTLVKYHTPIYFENWVSTSCLHEPKKKYARLHMVFIADWNGRLTLQKLSSIIILHFSSCYFCFVWLRFILFQIEISITNRYIRCKYFFFKPQNMGAAYSDAWKHKIQFDTKWFS